MAFANPKMIINAYSITIMLTIFGTILGLFICAMTAYVLQRQYFRSRNFFALFFYFTTLFSGGLVPWYILMIRYLHLKNSFLALLLPPLIAVFDIIIMRSFLKSVPEALAESAKIDGAGEFRTFFQIYLPILKPALATVGLFIALRYWNDWYNAMLFISEKRYFPLQFYLYNMLTSMEFAITAASQGGITVKAYPAESFKLAMTVIATGPIIFLYPFVQKYFIKGLTVGAVRG
jgi:putative aldouronate transport system permease protein